MTRHLNVVCSHFSSRASWDGGAVADAGGCLVARPAEASAGFTTVLLTRAWPLATLTRPPQSHETPCCYAMPAPQPAMEVDRREGVAGPPAAALVLSAPRPGDTRIQTSSASPQPSIHPCEQDADSAALAPSPGPLPAESLGDVTIVGGVGSRTRPALSFGSRARAWGGKGGRFLRPMKNRKPASALSFGLALAWVSTRVCDGNTTLFFPFTNACLSYLAATDGRWRRQGNSWPPRESRGPAFPPLPTGRDKNHEQRT